MESFSIGWLFCRVRTQEQGNPIDLPEFILKQMPQIA